MIFSTINHNPRLPSTRTRRPTCRGCVVGSVSARLGWLLPTASALLVCFLTSSPVADGFPARAYDACNMNDLRELEHMPCTEHCTSEYGGGGGSTAMKVKRAIFDEAALLPLLADDTGAITVSPSHHTAAAAHSIELLFEEANRHLFTALLNEIERVRLLLAEEEAQQEDASQDADLHQSTTTSTSQAVGVVNKKQHHGHQRHRKWPLSTAHSATTTTTTPTLAAVLIERIRRGTSSGGECVSCMTEMFSRFSSCTLRGGGGRLSRKP